MGVTRTTAAAVVGYALGNVPVADAVSHGASGGRIDLREWGSRNPGAFNAARTLGALEGIAVAVGDVMKAAAAGVIGRRLAGTNGAHVAAVAAVVGHCYPAAPGRIGGKGVSSSGGQCLATFPVYFPVDALVAASAVAAMKPGRPGRHKAFIATMVPALAWIGAGVVWWRRGLPNAWGPPPTAALPLANAASTVVIVTRFIAAARKKQPDDIGDGA